MIGTFVEITIGETVYRGALPHMRHRFDVYVAYRAARGYLAGDEGKPSGTADAEDLMVLGWCAVGLCWADKPLDVPSFREVRRECRRKAKVRGIDYDPSAALYEYGEHIQSATMGDWEIKDLGAAGHQLLTEICNSIPTAAEVEEAEDPTGALEAGSTSTSSEED